MGRLANSGQYVDWNASYIDDLPLNAVQATLTVCLSGKQVWKGVVSVRCGTVHLSECGFLAHMPATKNSLISVNVACDVFDGQASIVVQTYEMDTLCSAAHCARPIKIFGYGRGQFASVHVVTGQLVL
jgi:hypothetical protein